MQVSRFSIYDRVLTGHTRLSFIYQDMETSKYLIPGALVSTLERVIQSRFPTKEKGALMILDIGAGTGFVGEKCTAAGFTNLVAIDLSAKMLAIAEEKNIYKHMVCDSLYNWRKHFIAGQFDVALTASVFTPGQLKPAALDEIICLVKPGKENLCCLCLCVFFVQRASGASFTMKKKKKTHR